MSATTAAPRLRRHRPAIRARHFVVSSGHYLASAAAFDILRRGGNAIDAGVAAGICINILLPEATNFGGVAPIIVYHRTRNEVRSISGLGCWGKHTSISYFNDHWNGAMPEGVLRSVVPGAPDAWLTALARYGNLTFEDVIAPAIELCERGFAMYPTLQRNLARSSDTIRDWPSTASVFLPGGCTPEIGDVLVQSDLARTFRRMVAAERAASGRGRSTAVMAARDEFYRGDIGKEIVEFISESGGFITEEDLASFSVDVEEPPSINYHGVDVYACGPWCQGPVMLQALNVLERFDLREMGHNSADYLSAVVQALDLSFSDREAYYGDPKFIDVPLTVLLSKEYARRQQERVDTSRSYSEMPEPGALQWPGEVRPKPSVADASVPVEPDTSYLCVVDSEGNAFSATPSDGVTSTPLVPGLGLICSSRGSQSHLDPSHASSLQPGKRPRLTPNPAMAFKDGRLFMPFGTPGGDMQPQTMTQVFLNIVEFGMDPQEAIEEARIGSYNFPDSFTPHPYRKGLRRVESGVPEAVIEELVARGNTIERWPAWTRVAGNACAIVVDNDRETLTAGADLRAEAYAIGW